MRARSGFRPVPRWRARAPLGVSIAAALAIGMAGAAPAQAAPADPAGTEAEAVAEAEAAARAAASEQAPRVGDLADHSTPPPVGDLADHSTPPPVGELADTADPLPDDELGAALAQAEATGKPVEIASETTETSISYAQPDGTVEVQTAAGPVRTRVDGDWAEVDTTLELTDAGVQPVAVTGDITFSAGGGQPMAVLGDGAGTSISLQWPDQLPTPELEGDTATYRGVLPDVDLVLTATRLGFTQHLVVTERPDAATVAALASLEFPTATEGATLVEGADDQLQIVDDEGAVAGTAAAPIMWDARTDPHTDQPAAVAEIGLELAPASAPATDATLVLTPPTRFLTDPATVYPVVIDPTQALGVLGDTFIQTGINSPQGGATELRSGTYDGGATRARSLLRFDVAPVKNRVVQSATLSLWQFHSWSCSPRWVDIRDAGDFDPNTVNWGTQPPIGGIVGNANTGTGYSAACPDNWVNFDLTGWTAHYADARNGRGTIMPLAVQAGSETDNHAWMKFNSGNAGGGVPTLTVTYDGNCDQYSGHAVCGAVRDKYYALGGPGGTLGLPTTSTAPVRDGGSFNHFQRGSIYFSPASGAHMITGGTREKWASLGWEGSYLGFPTTDEVCGLRDGGCYNHFQGGSIYGSPATGVHTIRGAIRDKWASLGWETSSLGLPTTDEGCGLRDGGCYNQFQDGSIYWSPATGAHTIRGVIRDKWASLGWETSYLGYPTTDGTGTASTIRGAYNHFQGGSIYWSTRNGAHTIRGPIRDKWASLGWETSYLGFPTTDDTAVSGGAYNHFTGGSIYFSPATGAHTIRGWIRDKWAQLGWERSILGFPTTDEVAIPGGAHNDFTGGSIYSSIATAAHAIYGPIRDYWLVMEATTSYLGFPRSDQYATDYGIRTDFTGGQILVETGDRPRDCTITGTSGPDDLPGTPRDDIICALGGNDTASGLEGSDILRGGTGADSLTGGPGNDSVTGGPDEDSLLGEDGLDVLDGEAGADQLSGGPGDDELRGGEGNDLMRGDEGTDVLADSEGAHELVLDATPTVVELPPSDPLDLMMTSAMSDTLDTNYQQSIRDCVARADFEYVTPETAPAYANLGFRPTAAGGYGIVLSHTPAAIDAQVAQRVAARTANYEYAETLPEQQQETYLTLVGHTEASHSAPAGQPMSCTTAAIETVLQPALQAQEALAPAMIRMDSAMRIRPDVQQVTTAWSQCMALAGHTYADPSASERAIMSALGTATPPDLQALLTREQTIATADIDCRQQVGYDQAIEAAVVAEWQAAGIDNQLINTATGAVQ